MKRRILKYQFSSKGTLVLRGFLNQQVFIVDEISRAGLAFHMPGRLDTEMAGPAVCHQNDRLTLPGYYY